MIAFPPDEGSPSPQSPPKPLAGAFFFGSLRLAAFFPVIHRFEDLQAKPERKVLNLNFGLS